MGFFDLLSSGVETISANELRDKLVTDKPFLLDVREPYEHQRKNIPGSVLIPLGQLSARLSELESFRDRTIVVYCASGTRSASACGLLKAKGFQVLNLSGGMNRWK